MRRAKLRDRYPEKSRLASVLQAASKRRSRQIGTAFVPDVCLLAASLHTTHLASLHTTPCASLRRLQARVPARPECLARRALPHTDK